MRLLYAKTWSVLLFWVLSTSNHKNAPSIVTRFDIVLNSLLGDGFLPTLLIYVCYRCIVLLVTGAMSSKDISDHVSPEITTESSAAATDSATPSSSFTFLFSDLSNSQLPLSDGSQKADKFAHTRTKRKRTRYVLYKVIWPFLIETHLAPKTKQS